MNKFIRIKNRIINTEKVYDFQLDGNRIYVCYAPNENYMAIECAHKHEASLIFEDIPHLIDTSYIPNWVRENEHPNHWANYNSDFDELPF